MGIALDIIRQSEVDDVSQVVYIQSASSHICCHKQLSKVVAELLHRKVALLLTQVAMQRFGIIAVLDKFIGHLLSLNLCATEDDGKNAWIVVYDAFQRQILILGVHHIIYVVNALRTLVAATHNNLFIVVQIVLSHTFYFLAHGGREHQRVMLF